MPGRFNPFIASMGKRIAPQSLFQALMTQRAVPPVPPLLQPLPTPPFEEPIRSMNPFLSAGEDQPTPKGPMTEAMKEDPKAQSQPQAPQVQSPEPPTEPMAQPARFTPPASAAQPSGQEPTSEPQPKVTGQLAERFGAVQEAIQRGDFDPQSGNYTTFGSDLVGRGTSPMMRFMDAAQAATMMTIKRSDKLERTDVDGNVVTGRFRKGLEDPGPPSPYKSNRFRPGPTYPDVPQDIPFRDTLGDLPDRINPANWKRMLDESPSGNIEDRRGDAPEETPPQPGWQTKRIEEWSEQDKKDFDEFWDMKIKQDRARRSDPYND